VSTIDGCANCAEKNSWGPRVVVSGRGYRHSVVRGTLGARRPGGRRCTQNSITSG